MEVPLWLAATSAGAVVALGAAWGVAKFRNLKDSTRKSPPPTLTQRMDVLEAGFRTLTGRLEQAEANATVWQSAAEELKGASIRAQKRAEEAERRGGLSAAQAQATQAQPPTFDPSNASRAQVRAAKRQGLV